MPTDWPISVESSFPSNPDRRRRVEAAQRSNENTMMVDGGVLKRGGRLTGVDVGQVVDESRVALTALRKRANWW